jgi:hypothetical protein
VVWVFVPARHMRGEGGAARPASLDQKVRLDYVVVRSPAEIL